MGSITNSLIGKRSKISIISEVFDWKETDEMYEWILRMKKHGFNVYLPTDDDGSDSFVVYASKSKLTASIVNNYFDNYGGTIRRLTKK